LTATVGPLPPTISDIPDRIISLGATSPAMHSRWGSDTALNNLLSATSSNPSALRGMLFSGVPDAHPHTDRLTKGRPS
jgi:hypothetical protein